MGKIEKIKMENQEVPKGDWQEVLSVFCGQEENSDDLKIMYVARFGAFKEPKQWGRVLGFLIRKIAMGEAKIRQLNESHVEHIEAKMVEGFNDVLLGTDTIKNLEQRLEVEKDSQNDLNENINWNPQKIDF